MEKLNLFCLFVDFFGVKLMSNGAHAGIPERFQRVAEDFV